MQLPAQLIHKFGKTEKPAPPGVDAKVDRKLTNPEIRNLLIKKIRALGRRARNLDSQITVLKLKLEIAQQISATNEETRQIALEGSFTVSDESQLSEITQKLTKLEEQRANDKREILELQESLTPLVEEVNEIDKMRDLMAGALTSLNNGGSKVSYL